ncbi:Phosphoenolpyruvate-dependent phosphotransferase system [bacterium HR19]|nr:Phosphoenolpyruvate-dependent phosphotransferase system [bacterium HR19]
MNTVIKESINIELEKQKVYGKLKEIADILHVDVATIYIYDEKRRELILWCSYGLERDSWGTRIPINRGLVGKCAREMRPISVKEPSKHPDFYYVEGSGEEKYQSFLAIPVTQEGKLLGLFVVQTIEMKFFLSEEIRIIWAGAERFVKEILKLQKIGGEQRWKKASF